MNENNSKKQADSEFVCKLSDMMEVTFKIFRDILKLSHGMWMGKESLFLALMNCKQLSFLNISDIVISLLL